ncbi:MAG: sulfatase [Candidatus Alcyoniella australis]|nr:sulfatase [Candidatus Alcyoniella australis]
MGAIVRKTASRSGWVLLIAALIGVVRGVLESSAGAYLSQGMLTLALRSVAGHTAHAMAWGLLIGLILGLFNLANFSLLRTRGGRVTAAVLFTAYWLFFAVIAFLHAALAYESHIPADYREQVTFDVTLNTLLLPMLSEAVNGWSSAFIRPLLGLALLGTAIAVGLPLLIGLLVRALRRKRAEAAPLQGKNALWPGLVGLGLWALTAALPGLLGQKPEPTAFPVVLISIDTLRADHLGCYGYERAFTPVLDRLAEEGVLFEQVASLSPWTLASHVTMLSAQNPLAHGVTSIRLRIPQRTFLLQELLSNAGYATGAAVSNFLLSPDYGFAQGFQSYVYLPEQRGEWAAAAAREFFDHNAKRPFFFFLHTYDPHYPYDAPLFYNDRFWKNRPEPLGFPDSFPEFARENLELTAEQLEYVLARYDAEVAYSDHVVGQTISELQRLGIYDQALIVVTSDHGEEFLDHGFLGHSVTLYDEVLHVPLIVKLPHGRLAGTRIEQQVRLSDLPAFIAAQAGLQFPDPHEGRDLSYLLGDENAAEPGPALAFTNLFGPPRFSRRAAGWKWISQAEFHYGQYERTADERLFDLDQDPREGNNLAGELHEQAAQMAQAAAREIEALKSISAIHGGASQRDIDPETLQRLRSLGYLQ